MIASLPSEHLVALVRAAAAESAGAPQAAAAHYAAALAALPGDAADAAFDLRGRRAAQLLLAGDYGAADAELGHMAFLAGRDHARRSEVLVRRSELQIARGDVPAAAALAHEALTLAPDGGVACAGRSLAALAEATHLLGDYVAAEAYARAALASFEAAGDAVAAGHCLRRLGLVAVNAGRVAEGRALVEQALARSRALDDRAGEARALNALGIAAADYAEARAFYEQALALSVAGGDREGEATQANNLAVVYATLGLYGQARAFAEQAAASLRQIGGLHLLAVALETLGRAHEGLGGLDAARASYQEGLALAERAGTPLTAACCVLGLGRTALAAGDGTAALAHCDAAADRFAIIGALGEQATALAWLGAVHLRRGDATTARQHTAAAAALLDAGHSSSEFPPQEVWWWRFRALAVALPGQRPAAPADLAGVLQRAYAAMAQGCATLSDTGLRRNYLCRVPINHAIVEAAQALPESPPAPPGPAVGRAGLQAQLTRMLTVAARLNEQHDADQLRELLLDEVVELSGASRILLASECGPAEPELLLSRGVGPAELAALRAAARPYIERARAQRRPLLVERVELDLAPVGPLLARSLVAVPLISAGRLSGVLYADLPVAFGALDEADLDLLGLLGVQAATALENARLYAELEGRVARRTAQLEAANRALSASMAEAERARASAESASAAKSAFLANMSHELRTPLNAVLGFTQLLTRDRALSSTQRERLAIVARSGEHLLELINTVLDMAKIEAGRMQLTSAPFDLRELLGDVADLFALRTAARQLTFTVELDPELPRAVNGDASRLRQILINLISNAIKFTYSGAITVRVSGRRDGPRLRLQIAIADTGIGIAPDELAGLFQPFVQTASGRLAREGSGLGLAISRQLARLMGGDITVVSAPGAGSVFTCTVDLMADAGGLLPQTHRRMVTVATRGGPWRALVADDGADNRRLLVELLHGTGFEVREAADGAEAVALCTEWRPQLLLVDLHMRGIDGFAAVQAIKQTPAGRSTVVIAVTASVLGQDHVAAMASGCDELITKPVRADHLFALIARQLGLPLVELDGGTLVAHSHHN